jgi:hypothetical protein
MPMRTNMLEYTKTILQKVSFSPRLFAKELRKSRKLLTRRERIKLLLWLKQQFNGQLSRAIRIYEYSLLRHKSHVHTASRVAF